MGDQEGGSERGPGAESTELAVEGVDVSPCSITGLLNALPSLGLGLSIVSHKDLKGCPSPDPLGFFRSPRSFTDQRRCSNGGPSSTDGTF